MTPADEPPFVSDRHAYYVGWVIGIAMRHGLNVTPVVDEHGNYRDRFNVVLADERQVITLVVPPPPDDWEPL